MPAENDLVVSITVKVSMPPKAIQEWIEAFGPNKPGREGVREDVKQAIGSGAERHLKDELGLDVEVTWK